MDASDTERPRPPSYEELDVRASPVGELLLRRRRVPGLGTTPIYEITLDGDLLMSSWLDASERALATATLGRVRAPRLEILIGGLGLGRTLEAALADERVARVTVVELSGDVVRWMRDGLVPWGPALLGDPRVHVHEGDFFAAVAGRGTLAPPAGGYGAILVDIDHAPDALLGPAHQAFYAADALARAAGRLAPGGAFGFWSSGEPQDDFARLLASALADVAVHRVEVFNPMIDEQQVDTIYVGQRRA
jgi:spermidine synthase